MEGCAWLILAVPEHSGIAEGGWKDRRNTQSQEKPFSHTVFSVTVHGMDDLKTPHHFVQHSQWEFNFYIYFRETAGLIYTYTG